MPKFPDAVVFAARFREVTSVLLDLAKHVQRLAEEVVSLRRELREAQRAQVYNNVPTKG